MAKVIQFKRRKQSMSAEEFIDICDTIEILVEEVRPERLEKVQGILHEMRWNAQFNAKFRESTRDQLQNLVDELYAETQADD